MPKCLTQHQIKQYHESSIVFPVRVLADQETQLYRQACDELEIALGGTPRTIDVRQMHLHFRWAFDLAAHRRVLDAAEDLLGPDLLIWATELFSKHPHGAAVSIGWHRDAPYMGFNPPHAVTVWIALGPSTRASGCMQVVPEPMREDRAPDQQHPPDARDGVPAAEASSPGGEVLDVVLAPGEMSMHSPTVLHGSGTNSSDEKRVGFVVRLVAPTARPRKGRPPAILVRGEDRYGHFQLVEPAEKADWDSALAGLKRSAAQHLDAMLQNTRADRLGSKVR